MCTSDCDFKNMCIACTIDFSRVTIFIYYAYVLVLTVVLVAIIVR